jgi:hypothetical protein
MRRLSGRSHEVWTSVFVCHPASGQVHSFQEVSQVRSASSTAVSSQVSGESGPLDKAGACAAQDAARKLSNRRIIATLSVCRWKKRRAFFAPSGSPKAQLTYLGNFGYDDRGQVMLLVL